MQPSASGKGCKRRTVKLKSSPLITQEVETLTSEHLKPAATFQQGLMAGVLGYCIWGLFPLYFKVLGAVTPLEILAHRIVWSFVLLLTLVSFRGMLPGFINVFRSPLLLRSLAITTVLITINWGLFIYAVSIGQTKSASLGYYINPFVNVALGMVFLGERLTLLQKIALVFAALGVGWLVVQHMQIPWIPLTLGFTFGVYGLLRKRSSVKPLLGLTVETALMTPIALGYAFFLFQTEALAIGSVGTKETIMLLCAGFLTTVPLLLFTFGAQTIPYSTMGFIQFITPSLHLFCALVVFRETITGNELISFVLIWIGLCFFVAQLLVPAEGSRQEKALQEG